MRRLRGLRLLWLWIAFLAANLWVGWLAFAGPGYALGDVYLYRWWIELALSGGAIVGIDTSWVYPVLALLPMAIAAVGGLEGYAITWLVLVVALNTVAFFAVVGYGRKPRSLAAGWWWTAFLVALGPIAVARIDSITVPLAVTALAVLARHPVIAGVLLAVATWMKVWPAALIAAIVVASRARWKVVFAGAAVSVAVMAAALVLGGGGQLFSFITMQAGRGIQIEAFASAPWRWLAVAGVGGFGIEYDEELLTYQVFGPGTEVVAALLTPVLAFVAFAVGLLATVLLRRGVRAASVLPPLALALVSAFIVINKVGSPQFICWLAAVIVFGLLSASTGGPSFRVPAVLTLVIALLTQIVYPVLYGYLLALEPAMLIALDARNVLLVVLLVWAVRAMVTAPRRRRRQRA